MFEMGYFQESRQLATESSEESNEPERFKMRVWIGLESKR